MLDPKRARADEAAAARTALQHSEGPPAGAARSAIWHWDLASGKVEWDEGLKSLFGFTELLTSAAWRENRIHPEDRDRVKASLERATIVNHGAVWSEQYRFFVKPMAATPRSPNARTSSVTTPALARSSEASHRRRLSSTAHEREPRRFHE